ncbi:MAG: 5'-nucleotidase C-terminal domain-containing protein [Armatimonadetes bacterium]|nr:5'-nucleotidase C-terminal domain-containing protein [Armatimonadota bacterium]
MKTERWLATGVLFVVFALAAAAGAADQPVADLPLTTKEAGVSEVSFGDLATDALCHATGAPIAFVAAVSFKTGTIEAGPFSEADVARLLQIPSESWAVSSLRGAQIRAALERSLSRLPLPSGAFLQVSGITVVFDPSGPRDNRVKQLLVGGAPIDEAATYEVAMPLSLAKGGAGYFQIFDANNIVRQGSEGLSRILYQFALSRGHVSYTGQGRLVPSR